MQDQRPGRARRRQWLALGAAALLLAGCLGSGPEKAEALDQIAARIRTTFSVGEKRLENLAYKDGAELDDGRYAIFVEYDLISTMPEIGLFNTSLKSGERSHITGERYVFVRSSAGWTLE